MKRFYLVFIIPLLTAGRLFAQEAEQESVKLSFGGRIDAVMFYDSYKEISGANGLQYYYPLAPSYDRIGNDLNKQGSLRFGITSTRLNTTMTVPELLGARITAFVEADFMGSSHYGAIRLRHAFVNMDWGKDRLQIGQTDKLILPVENTPNTVSYGGGEPINPSTRTVQFIYTRLFTPCFRWSAGIGMAGNASHAAESMIPEVQTKVLLGNPEKSFIGWSGGMRSLRPRRITDDEIRTFKRLYTFNATVFGQYKSDKGDRIAASVLFAQDPPDMNLPGGYAPRLSDVRAGIDDYHYVPVRSVAAWIFFETRIFNGWQPGFFAGWIKNLGTGKAVDLDNGSFNYYGLDWHVRFAPQIFYHYKRLSFGLEYQFALASWGASFNEKYRPTEHFEHAIGHRVTTLARFRF